MKRLHILPIAVTENSDKLALIKFAVYNIRQMRKSGMDDDKISLILTEQFEFSDSLVEQLL
ncbi:MAG: hypothetical protein J5877_07425 [Clostridia bacterium]|nr:hypothetical protein [Clostridia bacterium]